MKYEAIIKTPPTLRTGKVSIRYYLCDAKDAADALSQAAAFANCFVGQPEDGINYSHGTVLDIQPFEVIA